ncbi:hypothetical protein [Bradyrhizobium genosp. P]|uniref:hypothetical protein n=1 Tax=Bradyrhizobium genosp. P TaxID=83641 RepID=UPI003CFA21A8
MGEHQWADVSAYGDPWEVQVDMKADPNQATAWRYRSAMLGNLRADWSSGKPPAGAYANPAALSEAEVQALARDTEN